MTAAGRLPGYMRYKSIVTQILSLNNNNNYLPLLLTLHCLFTNTMPLHVEILFNEFQYVPAFAVSSVLVIMAVILLIIRSIMEHRGKKEEA